MTMMSGAVKPLADLPQFKEVLTILDNPIIAILVGAGITALIQSSAASLGILQSLAMTGSISFSMALPVIMGQNIGTCITALLSSIGTTKSAKRVTAVHIYFNVLGTVICLSGFYIANSIFHFTFTDQPISSFMIAVVHSAFNLITTFILLPFCNQLEKLAVITVRDKRLKPGKQDPHAVLLDERLLLSPSFAIAECRNATTKMATLCATPFWMPSVCSRILIPPQQKKSRKTKKPSTSTKISSVLTSSKFPVKTSPRPTATMFRSCCIPSAISSVSATTR